jgi:hypothetical protein
LNHGYTNKRLRTPGTTSSRHVASIHNEEGTIILILCRDPHTLASAVDLGCRLDSHEEVSVVADISQFGTLRLISRDIGHGTVRWIGTGEEVPFVEEVVASLVVEVRMSIVGLI